MPKKPQKVRLDPVPPVTLRAEKEVERIIAGGLADQAPVQREGETYMEAKIRQNVRRNPTLKNRPLEFQKMLVSSMHAGVEQVVFSTMKARAKQAHDAIDRKRMAMDCVVPIGVGHRHNLVQHFCKWLQSFNF